MGVQSFDVAINIHDQDPSSAMQRARLIAHSLNRAFAESAREDRRPVASEPHLIIIESFAGAVESTSLAVRLDCPQGDATPDIVKPAIEWLADQSMNKDEWIYGRNVSAAKLFLYGPNILNLMSRENLMKVAIPVWKDDGVPEKRRALPKTYLSHHYFSVSTSRREGHLVGKVKDCTFGIKMPDERFCARLILEKL